MSMGRTNSIISLSFILDLASPIIRRITLLLFGVFIIIIFFACCPIIKFNESIPNILPVESNPVGLRYSQEFSISKHNTDLDECKLSESASRILGNMDLHFHDAIKNQGLELIASYSGHDKNWSRGQKIWIKTGFNDDYNVLSGLDSIIISQGGFVNINEIYAIILSGLDHTCNQNKVMLYNIKSKVLNEIATGGVAAISPDRKKVLLLDKDALEYYRFQIWHGDTFQIDTLFTIWPSSSGSGTNWRWRWSIDSKAISFQGSTRGFSLRDRSATPRNINLIYVLDTERIQGQSIRMFSSNYEQLGSEYEPTVKR